MPQAEQLSLLDEHEPLVKICLLADSPRSAYYEVSVIHLPGAGYLIQKASGSAGAKPNLETWFRPTYSAAVEKQQQLINGKQRRKKGRIYREIKSEPLGCHGIRQ
jgi:hypothetical protein